MNHEKLGQLVKILNARKAINEFPTEFNDLAALLQEEAKQLGQELLKKEGE